ncbi:MAG: hypothetical protein A2X18_04315 [Bacteroidetes bacterium GWF2_40_14]|nr:MAG: hypothetical protein A2X18_04315 [Bacteroidetes bacterium GWF2_40_14]
MDMWETSTEFFPTACEKAINVNTFSKEVIPLNGDSLKYKPIPLNSLRFSKKTGKLRRGMGLVSVKRILYRLY